ncbi:MAG TPA: FG-GAP-like repeat-containing protein [Isosphaeraceae bacterium]|jgi:hypothetical protein|nr:FG-GAP-like repeat-containing protein [Isosphaeraceae bacterium]
MRLRRCRLSSRFRPDLQNLEARTLLSLDFKLAFTIAGAGSYTTLSSVAADAAGDIYTAGQFQGKAEFGGTGPSSTLTPQGRADGFLAKYAPSGKLIWALDAKLAPTKVGEVADIAVDSAGNTYMVGIYGTAITLGAFTLTSTVPVGFVAKVDSSGTVLWAKSLDSTVALEAFGVAVDGAGDNYITGGFEGKAFGGTLTDASAGGNRDVFVAKLLPNGTLSWAVRMGGLSDDYGRTIVVDGAGTAYVGGEFQGSALFGSTTLVSGGGYNGFAEKLNASGTVLWAIGIGAAAGDNVAGIAIDGGGNVFVGGDGSKAITFGPAVTLQAGTQSAFVAKYTGQGDVIWAHVLIATGNSLGGNVVVDGAGSVYLAGAVSGTADFDPGPATYNLTTPTYNPFLWKLDGAGRFQLARTAIAPQFSFGIAAIGPKGTVDFAGYYTSTLLIGPFSLPDVAGSPFSNSFVSVLSPAVAYDFDNDGRADLALLRPTTYQWLIAPSGGGGGKIIPFGGPGDVPVPGNYLGTGKNEVAVYRPSTATWYSLAFGAIQFGAPGDVPVPGDYDGDGKTDLAVYRPSTGQWFIRESTSGPVYQPFGAPGMIPVLADYDGDGKTDIAVFDPRTATWYVLGSTVGAFSFQFGAPGLDLPIPGDYTGAGHASFAVYRPGSALWLISGVGAVSFGAPNGDLPVPADYLGVGHDQLAVYRPSTAQWFINGGGFFGFGQPGLDLPLELPLVYRAGFFGKAQSRAVSAGAPGDIASSSLVVPIAQIPATAGPVWPTDAPQPKRKLALALLG